jgi:hypothetical protein
MSFTLEKGLTRGGPELRDIWGLRDLENDAFWVWFTTAEEVYDPKGPNRVKIAPAPEDMVAWLQANPHLKTEKPKPTSVGGEKGMQFDAIVAPRGDSFVPKVRRPPPLPLQRRGQVVRRKRREDSLHSIGGRKW